MDIRKLNDDIIAACSIWNFDKASSTEMTALHNLYRQQLSIMTNNKVKKPAFVAFQSWALATEEQLKCGYLWTPACPILTSIIVNRLRSEANNACKTLANTRASLVGLSYEQITNVIDEAASLSYGSVLPSKGRLITQAAKEREAQSEAKRQEALRQARREIIAEESRKRAEEMEEAARRRRLERLATSSYRPSSTPMSHCDSANGKSSSRIC